MQGFLVGFDVFAYHYVRIMLCAVRRTCKECCRSQARGGHCEGVRSQASQLGGGGLTRKRGSAPHAGGVCQRLCDAPLSLPCAGGQTSETLSPSQATVHRVTVNNTGHLCVDWLFNTQTVHSEQCAHLNKLLFSPLIQRYSFQVFYLYSYQSMLLLYISQCRLWDI